MKIKDIEKYLVSVNDFPKKGISFKDITPLFLRPDVIKEIINIMKMQLKNIEFDVIVAPESRGYLFGLPLSLELNKPFVMIRKPNKLPRKTLSVKYDLEYGSNILEVHKDDIPPNSKVLIVDDLIATGGTSIAIQELMSKLNCSVVAQIYLIELTKLVQFNKLEGEIFSLIKY